MSCVYFYPPSNTDTFNRYYRERQVNITIPEQWASYVIGKKKQNILFLSKKYNVSIQPIKVCKNKQVEFILTHNRWLKLDHPNNNIELCKSEIMVIYSNAIYNNEQKTLYGCKTCITGISHLDCSKYIFKPCCMVCYKKKGCVDCRNEDGTYNNICEHCGRENCCPTCLNIDGTVRLKCSSCKR
jgi:hypothetical protein